MSEEQIVNALRDRFGDKIKEVEVKKERRIRVRISGEHILEVARYLKEEQEFDHLSLISAVEYPERFEVVYHLWSYPKKILVQINAELPKEKPEISSLTELWKAADWHEREAYDLMGIVFVGHPNLKRMFLPEDFEGHPLRKDFKLKPAPWYKEE